jgi:hypothetical protein
VSERPGGDEGDEPLEKFDTGELELHDVEALPDREVMSVIGDVTIPLDPDIAADVLLGQGDAGDDASEDAGSST